jgi:Ca-activated chloride channel family protein
MLFRVTLQAEQAADDKANNLVFLIDVSGSMSSKDKLPLLKTAFSYLVSNLDADDTISIVTYSGKEAVVLDGCNGLESEKIMTAINSLVASGSTNGQAGLTMTYQIAEKHFKPEGNNRIIMASDGDLNVGISSTEELTAFIEGKRDQGVYLSVLGFGTGNYKDSKMEALADNGNGVYYYIDGETEAEKVFGTDIFGTLYTVAEDVKLQIEFNPDAISSYRLIGYENRVMNNEDFENDNKDAGEVGASHQVTVFYEIKLNGDAMLHSEYMTLRVRYKNPGESLSLLNEYVLGKEIFDLDPDTDTRFITSVIETCMLISGSSYAEEITLEGIVEDLNSLDLTDPYKIEFRELLKGLVTENNEMDY